MWRGNTKGDEILFFITKKGKLSLTNDRVEEKVQRRCTVTLAVGQMLDCTIDVSKYKVVL